MISSNEIGDSDPETDGSTDSDVVELVKNNKFIRLKILLEGIIHQRNIFVKYIYSDIIKKVIV